MAEISAGLLWEIFTHVRSWLANLNRAGEQRKRQSIDALRGIITASRQTAVYLRQLDETGRRDHNTEQSLAVRWTELGFRLEDLGISKLAKRCQITGKHWSDPDHYDRDFLEKADVSLDRMERLATEILHQINR
jgi:hypothetical protein